MEWTEFAVRERFAGPGKGSPGIKEFAALQFGASVIVAVYVNLQDAGEFVDLGLRLVERLLHAPKLDLDEQSGLA